MELGDKVTIGGRTMLRPGFSLVGLTGRIVSSRADAPPGTLAVWMDWQEFGYENLDELPPVVNVPSAHLALASHHESAPPVAPLSLSKSATEQTEPPEDEEETERPKLRMI